MIGVRTGDPQLQTAHYRLYRFRVQWPKVGSNSKGMLHDQFTSSGDGKYKLLNVNPRIGSTFRLFAARNGSDVASALYLDVTAHTVPFTQLPERRKGMVETTT